MSSGFAVYRHSGKFGAHGPALVLGAAAVLGLPAGFFYAYLVRWMPFVYVNFLATAGYGAVFGLTSFWLLKTARVRNTRVAAASAGVAGLIGLYLAWSAHIHATFDGAPWLCRPIEVLGGMLSLFETGSWSLKGNVMTGVPLAIVWSVEGLIVAGVSALVAGINIAETPYCETTQCWLDEEKKIDTLAPFTEGTQRDALRAGDLWPLTQAKPKDVDATQWTRLTVKHSPKCQTFCTVRVSQVTRRQTKDGGNRDSEVNLSKDVILPHSSLPLITRFDQFGQASAAA